MDYLFSVQNLSKKYNNQFAINNINLNLKRRNLCNWEKWSRENNSFKDCSGISKT